MSEINLLNGLKEFFKKINKTKAVLGLSGGIDSAVCLALSVKALGNENITTIFMPDINLTSDESRINAINLAKQFNVKLIEIPINNIENSFKTHWKRNEIAEMNLKARIRMLILYDYANSNHALVIGTSNKSEIYLGYGTKYGDGASDIMPIGDLYKTEVYKLANLLNLPKEIINRKPSAELKKDQTDEEELGIKYELADKIIEALLNNVMNKEILYENFNKQDVDLVYDKIILNEHKRIQTHVIKK
jgi:NAD+ synthase